MIASRWAALFLVAGSACAGSHSNLTADHSKYLISMTPAARGANGEIVAGDKLVPVGDVDISYSTWSMFWTLLPLANRNVDVSDEINAQVAKAGGDAVVNLNVETQGCAMLSASLVGILPQCVSVRVRGQIVKASAGVPLTASSP